MGTVDGGDRADRRRDRAGAMVGFAHRLRATVCKIGERRILDSQPHAVALEHAYSRKTDA